MRRMPVVQILVLTVLAAAAFVAAQTPADNPLAPYIPKNLKPYFLEMLLLKDKPAALPEGERTQLMQKHLAYIRSHVEAGKFALVGRLTEENRLRGIVVIKADSLEEAQRLASADPLVQSGQLAVEVHPILLEDLSSVHFDYPAAN